MNAITAHDLQYRYSGTAIPPDNPLRTGVPDSVLLNRGELYEMVRFLNWYCANTVYTVTRQQFSKPEALKAERLIHTALPGSLRSFAHVTQWLRTNWASYA